MLQEPQKGTLCNKCQEIKVRDGKPPVKVGKIEDSGPKSDPEAKSVRQIRIRYSDIEEQNSDPFMRHWIILKNLGQISLGSDFEGRLEKKLILGQIAIRSPENYILP